MSIGRNDPCNCGSGKKYKKCCLAAAQAQKTQDFSYRRSRDIENNLMERLLRHANETLAPGSIEEAWDEFHCWEYSDGYDSTDLINQAFVPFYLFSWETDSEEGPYDPEFESKTVAESFLSAYRSRLSSEEVAILENANRSAFAFYEIREVKPGQGFLLRNILTGIEFEVRESAGSSGRQRGEVLFAMAFALHGRNQLLAISPYVLPPLSIQSLVELRKKLLRRLKTKNLADWQLAGFDIELRKVFFILLEPILYPQTPELCNTDGDPLLAQTLHFEITDPEAAFLALKSLSAGMISKEELQADAKLKAKRIYEVEIPWLKKNKAASHPGSNTVLGTIKIKGTKLKAMVNSNKRAAAIKRKILTALGPDARYQTKIIESIEGSYKPNPACITSEAIPHDQLPPEALEEVRKMADTHWTRWLDDKIPALNGKTPKQAAKSQEGRELLEALLNSYEQRSAHPADETTNLFRPDIHQLRSRLNLL